MSGRRSETPGVIIEDLRKQEGGGGPSDHQSVYSCPACGGVLWQIGAAGELEFACHTGHSYGQEELVIAKSRSLEQAASEAVRILREKAVMLRQLAARCNPGSPNTALLIDQAEQDDKHAWLLDMHILRGQYGRANSVDALLPVLSDVAAETRRRPDD